MGVVSSQTEIHAYALLSLTSAVPADCSKESIRGCTAEVKILDVNTETCSWRNVWAAAVAVNEKCVKKGKAGIAFGLGESPFLFPYVSTVALMAGDMQASGAS